MASSPSLDLASLVAWSAAALVGRSWIDDRKSSVFSAYVLQKSRIAVQEAILESAKLVDHLSISLIMHPKTAETICVPGSPDSARLGDVGLKSFLFTIKDDSANSFVVHGRVAIYSNKPYVLVKYTK